MDSELGVGVAGPEVAEAQQKLIRRYLHPDVRPRRNSALSATTPPHVSFNEYFNGAREGKGLLRPLPAGQWYFPLQFNMRLTAFLAGEFREHASQCGRLARE